MNASCTRVRRSEASNPSMVATSAPSTNEARERQPDTARPFTSTVQQPHSPCPQDSRAPVSPNCVCRSSIRLWCGSTLAVTGTPFSVKLMDRCWFILRNFQGAPGLRTQGAIDGLGIERQLRQTYADRVVDRIGDRRRNAEGRDFADPFGAERAVMLDVFDGKIFHHQGQIANARNLVIRQRCIGDLPAI